MKAALFDLDGVIVDTEGTYFDFWDSVGREYHLQPTFARDIKGTTLTDILTTYFPRQDYKDEVTRKIHDFEDTMKYPLFPGVMGFIKDLRTRGFKTAIVTSSDDVKMSFLYAQHPDFKGEFDAIVTGSMVSNSKPDPEGYLLAAKMVGVDIKDCYVFEDSFQGLEAGMISGATVVGLATTNPAEKIKHKAHEVIENFTNFNVDQLMHIRK